MTGYNFVVIDKNGKRITGEKEANTRDEVAKFLYERGYTIVSINEKLGAEFQKLFSSDIGGVPLKEKLVIAKQLSTMISAGIPIIQAIDILVQQTEKKGLKSQLTNVYKSIEAGSSLSEAFKKEKGIFSDIHINLMAAGEKSANLNEMLEKISVDLEKSKNLRGKITGAMIYPAIIMVVLVVVMFLMITVMVPQVKDLYYSLGKKEIPAITQFLVDVGTLFGNPAFLAILAILIVAGIMLYRYIYSTPKGLRLIDKLKLRIPVFGKVIVKYEVVQFCRLTSMLLVSGVQIIETVNIVINSSSNQIFKDIMTRAIDEVTKGVPLSIALAKYNDELAFPNVLLRIMATGEETGKVDQILEDMGKLYESELEQLTSNLTKLMEPLIMVVAGGMVGFLAVAIYLPIFQVGSLVN